MFIIAICKIYLEKMKDQNDTIDLTDNELKRLDNFPYMKRLKTILASNNRIVRIDVDVAKCMPNLHTLVMINNAVQELGDLDVLAEFKKLEVLALMENPVTEKEHYRKYLVYKLPSLRVLDFKRITDKVRSDARLYLTGSTRGCGQFIHMFECILFGLYCIYIGTGRSKETVFWN
jgi:Leucine-rich repeat